MKKIFVFVAFILLGFTACIKEDFTINNQGSYLIFYEIASTWTGYNFQVTVDQNGNLHIEEESELNNIHRESEYEIPEEDKLIIRRKLRKLMSVDMADKYGFGNENAPTDLPTKKIKYFSDVKSDSTYLYFPGENELPEELEDFMQIFQQIIFDNDTIK